MNEREIELRLKNAVENAAPDDLAGLLSEIDRRGVENKMKENTGKRKFRFVGLIAACLAVIVLAGVGGLYYRNNYTVATVVSLDVNPSIELKVNRNEKVLSCAGLNDEAKEILSGMDGGRDLEGAKLDVAVNAIVGAIVRAGYMDSLGSAILISVEDNDNERGARLQQELVATVDNVLQSTSNGASVISQSMTADAGLEAQAKENNISTGKAALINQIIALNSSMEFDKLAALSVEELRDTLKIGAPAMPIGKEAAKIAAETYAGTLEMDSVIVDVDADIDDRQPHYDVELYYDGLEYEYRVDAFTGEVLTGRKDITNNAGGGSVAAPSSYITAQQAEDAALTHAGVSRADAQNIYTETDLDDRTPHYEVTFVSGDTKYDYEIDAVSGSVLGMDREYVQSGPVGGSTGTDIGADAAKAAALGHAGLSESQVTGLRAEKDYDDGRWEYDVEFFYNNTEYDYTIDAASGEVIKYDSESHGQQGGGSQQPQTSAGTDIGADAAKAAALNHAGLSESQVTGLRTERDYEHGRVEYDVEFRSGDYEYEYTIDGATGAVLEHEKEIDD